MPISASTPDLPRGSTREPRHRPDDTSPRTRPDSNGTATLTSCGQDAPLPGRHALGEFRSDDRPDPRLSRLGEPTPSGCGVGEEASPQAVRPAGTTVPVGRPSCGARSATLVRSAGRPYRSPHPPTYNHWPRGDRTEDSQRAPRARSGPGARSIRRPTYNVARVRRCLLPSRQALAEEPWTGVRRGPASVDAGPAEPAQRLPRPEIARGKSIELATITPPFCAPTLIVARMPRAFSASDAHSSHARLGLRDPDMRESFNGEWLGVCNF